MTTPAFTCETIGLTETELQDRVIEAIRNSLLYHVAPLSEGGDFEGDSPLREQLNSAIQNQVDNNINKIATEQVLPNIETYIRDFKITCTNPYGEPTSEPQTFTEYLASRAENYILEPVNKYGETKAEKGYGWKKVQTRLEYLMDRHLHEEIERTVKKLLAEPNKILGQAVKQTLEDTLTSLSKRIQTSVTISN